MELYHYEDETIKTEIIMKSKVNDEEIELKQIDFSNIKMFLKKGIFIISGYLRGEAEKNLAEIMKLNKWSMITGTSKGALRDIEIKVSRNGYVLRHLIFEGYLSSYHESYDNAKGYRFHFILREHKKINRDGAYVRTVTLKGVKGDMIIIPREFNLKNSLLSGLNGLTGVSLLKDAGVKVAVASESRIITGALGFYFIAHGTGMVSEFVADITFVMKKEPEKMGSFNMTRDWVYKPIGEAISQEINNIFSEINLSKDIGRDAYNHANLAFSILTLSTDVEKSYRNLKGYEGAGIYYKIKYKDVAVSTWGRRLTAYRKYGSTTIKALLGDLGFLVPGTYSVKESIKSEIEKRK
ncbi:hypothetical protein DXA30_01010 [Fusobacterium ulcerans]|uniref:hypothetical protein n=1 Tax=Fusobacterium ulcerans TaxID=861 RepID=UPI000E473FE7|nr:hypothetical protein [Fusobacterium ulcerans]RGY67175.1 hypothetical protein DXA30_01010 [Fusobacterium ulcerans]